MSASFSVDFHPEKPFTGLMQEREIRAAIGGIMQALDRRVRANTAVRTTGATGTALAVTIGIGMGLSACGSTDPGPLVPYMAPPPVESASDAGAAPNPDAGAAPIPTAIDPGPVMPYMAPPIENKPDEGAP